MNIINAINITKKFNDNIVFKNLNFSAKRGEVVTIIGPSGQGKSTLLRCLIGLEKISDGTIEINGKKLVENGKYLNSKEQAEVLLDVGMVFQQPTPFPFSVYNNVAYGLRLSGIKDKELIDQRVEESLKQAAIWEETKDNLNRNAQAFSGGQQQRICIARALAVRPKVVLLDEPTSALDPISSSEIEETLMDLKTKFTFIMVTHNLQQAGRISDQT